MLIKIVLCIEYVLMRRLTFDVSDETNTASILLQFRVVETLSWW